MRSMAGAAGVLLLLSNLALASGVDDGVAAYRRGDFVKAQKILRGEVAAQGRSAADRARARAYLGAAYVALKDEASARAEFQALFKEFPQASLDEGEFPPRVIRVANEVRPSPGAIAVVEPEPAPEVKAAPDAGVAAVQKPRGSQPIKLAAPGLSYVDLDAKKGAFFIDYLAQEIAKRGGAIRVTTAGEISSLLSHERQKELLGCADDQTSCLAELSGALGVDGLITGSLAKLESGYVINLKIIRATDGSALSTLNGRVEDDDALLDFLSKAARTIVAEVPRALGRAGPEAPVAALEAVSSPSVRDRAWIPLVAGGVLLGAGSVAIVSAKGIESDLRAGEASRITDPVAARDRGRTFATAGYVLGAVGIAGLIAGGAMLAFGGPSELSTSALIGPEGASVALGGTF